MRLERKALSLISHVKDRMTTGVLTGGTSKAKCLETFTIFSHEISAYAKTRKEKFLSTFMGTHQTQPIPKIAGEVSGNNKADEIAILKKRIEEEKAKFIEAHKDNLPSPEERYQEGLRDLRMEYAQNFKNILGRAERLADNSSLGINRYLDHIWMKSPEARELKLQLALKEMTPKELDLFNKAVKILDDRKITYDKYELTVDDIYKELAKGFASAHQVSLSNHAYIVNSPLRRGIEVDDLIRKALDEGFKDVKPTANDRIVYRGVRGSHIDTSGDFIEHLIHAKKGETFVDKGYAYTSTRENSAQACNGLREEGLPEVKLRIYIPEGAKVSDNTERPQSEVIFPRNSKFRIVKEAKENELGSMEIEAEYVLPHETIKKVIKNIKNASKNCAAFFSDIKYVVTHPIASKNKRKIIKELLQIKNPDGTQMFNKNDLSNLPADKLILMYELKDLLPK